MGFEDSVSRSPITLTAHNHISFSVALCTYNGARYLEEQLESIAAQTRPADELVVCDDRSTDSSADIVSAFAARAPFTVRLVVNEQRLGSTENFARAAALCTGTFIALSDQDDVWLSHKLASLEKEFKNPAVGLVFSDAEIVDEKLRPAGKRMWHQVEFREREKRLVRKGRAIEVLLPGWSVMGATMAFRSKFLDLVLPIPTNLPMIHDGWIALVIAAVAPITFIDEPLILYRQHASQQVGAPVNRARDRSISTPKFLRGAALRANSYRELVGTIQKVKERLADRPAYHGDETMNDMDTWLQHIKVRMNLPAGSVARFSAVLKELLAMRYHRYSNGTVSAAKDLVYGARIS